MEVSIVVVVSLLNPRNERSGQEKGVSAAYVGILTGDEAIGEVWSVKNQLVYMGPESLLYNR